MQALVAHRQPTVSPFLSRQRRAITRQFDQPARAQRSEQLPHLC
jgi:hypothetical protein